ncbi:ABC transporter substrate-binding protein [Maridesulfovibrio sp.]|uniref:ABC transporter substrate-binding protein n=1 Tax=unclassified Maridesulfovibrio TaxID=2794999 RepID=UPI003B0047A6
MKRNISFLAISSLFILFAFCLAFSTCVQAEDVFIVHSYRLDNICGGPQQQGVLESLAEAGFREGENLVVHTYAMDTKKVNNTPELIDKQADIVLEKVRKIKPDVLVLLDDNAFRTVGLKLVDSGVSVVFSGMNGQPEDYDRKIKWMDSRSKPGHNITGVYEKLHFIDACRVQKKILPDLEKVLVFSDESPTGKAVLKQVQKEITEAGGSLGIEFEIVIAHSWEEYTELIKKGCADPSIGTIYPAVTLLKDAEGKTYSTSEVLTWTVANCQVPGIPINYSFARLGMLGGAGVDFISMGRQAGRMVASVLNGTSPADIPIEDAQRYAFVFNLKRAKELGMVIPNDILMAADVIYK